MHTVFYSFYVFQKRVFIFSINLFSVTYLLRVETKKFKSSLLFKNIKG